MGRCLLDQPQGGLESEFVSLNCCAHWNGAPLLEATGRRYIEHHFGTPDSMDTGRRVLQLANTVLQEPERGVNELVSAGEAPHR